MSTFSVVGFYMSYPEVTSNGAIEGKEYFILHFACLLAITGCNKQL